MTVAPWSSALKIHKSEGLSLGFDKFFNLDGELFRKCRDLLSHLQVCYYYLIASLGCTLCSPRNGPVELQQELPGRKCPQYNTFRMKTIWSITKLAEYRDWGNQVILAQIQCGKGIIPLQTHSIEHSTCWRQSQWDLPLILLIYKSSFSCIAWYLALELHIRLRICLCNMYLRVCM
jgi:hypothetical protein